MENNQIFSPVQISQTTSQPKSVHYSPMPLHHTYTISIQTSCSMFCPCAHPKCLFGNDDRNISTFKMVLKLLLPVHHLQWRCRESEMLVFQPMAIKESLKASCNKNRTEYGGFLVHHCLLITESFRTFRSDALSA